MEQRNFRNNSLNPKRIAALLCGWLSFQENIDVRGLKMMGGNDGFQKWIRNWDRPQPCFEIPELNFGEIHFLGFGKSDLKNLKALPQDRVVNLDEETEGKMQHFDKEVERQVGKKMKVSEEVKKRSKGKQGTWASDYLTFMERFRGRHSKKVGDLNPQNNRVEAGGGSVLGKRGHRSGRASLRALEKKLKRQQIWYKENKALLLKGISLKPKEAKKVRAILKQIKKDFLKKAAQLLKTGSETDLEEVAALLDTTVRNGKPIPGQRKLRNQLAYHRKKGLNLNYHYVPQFELK